MSQQEKELQFKYDGEESLIDVNTFVTSQMHIATIFGQIQSTLYPDQQLQIKL